MVCLKFLYVRFGEFSWRVEIFWCFLVFGFRYGGILVGRCFKIFFL